MKKGRSFRWYSFFISRVTSFRHRRLLWGFSGAAMVFFLLLFLLLAVTPSFAQERASTGSGFLVDPNGSLLTAAHVVEGAASIEVRLKDKMRGRSTKSAWMISIWASTR